MVFQTVAFFAVDVERYDNIDRAHTRLMGENL